MPANQRQQGRILRIAGTVDFLLAVGFLLSPRLQFHMDPLARNLVAAFLLMGCVATFVIAHFVDRQRAMASDGEVRRDSLR